ncbi:SusC/RagA family TonB-linked outer membrane protein, partial [Desulfosarcina sp.]|nr:SusC/RagA family TonB-linked outer membrane protein [Desulfosarcina sp.]
WAFFSLFITDLAYGQSRTVSGTVKDNTGMTLPGVNIVEKGTMNGTTTNQSGKYEIDINQANSILVFTMIGMDTSEVNVGNKTNIDVAMTEDMVALDEVVVTAMGISREKNSLGYAVQSITGDEITVGGSISTISSLSGKVAGVQITSATAGIDGTPRVVIRGINSLSSDNQPLFIVDGIPISTNQAEGIGAINFSSVGQVNDFGSPLSDINPNDIESVNVLKGASAAALYGSRASNGVILITTKKASKSEPGIGVSFNSTTTWQNPLYIPTYQNEFGWGSNGIFDDPTMSGNCWGPRLDTGEEYVQYNSPVDPTTGEQIPTPWVSHKDNYNNYFETGLILSNNIAINASGEKVRARLSYTNMQQNDMIPNANMSKNMLSFNTSLDLTKKFSVDFFMNYSNTNSPNRSSGEGEGIMSGLLYMPSNVDVEELQDHLDAEGNMRSFHPLEINPYYVVRETTYPVKREHFNGKISLNYQILDWMKLRAGYSRDQTLSLHQTKVNINYVPNYWGNTDGNFSANHNFIVESNIDFLLEIDRRFKFNQDFRYTINFGGNMLDIKHDNTSAGTQGGLVLYSEYNLNNSRLSPWGDTYSSQKSMNSLFGQAILSYKTIAYLDFTGRNDWSSTLPEESRSYFYPSIAGTFLFTELMNINPGILSFGKLRASWAKVGLDANPYSLLRYAQRATNWTESIMPYYYTNPIPPVALKPEFNTTVELGLVLNFINNRLNLDMAVYDADIENQILQVPTAPSRGFTSELVNIGVMNNRGIEVMLEA